MSHLIQKIFARCKNAWANKQECPSRRPEKKPQPLPQPKPVPEMHLLRGKTVLVTGAGQNIGRAIAMEMAQQGANVVFTDIDLDACKLLARDLEAFQVQSKWYLSNVSSIEDIGALCADLRNDGIIIDILVNNVGVRVEPMGLQQSTIDQWRQTFDTNVIGPLYLSQQIVSQMIENSCQGSIIFITSIHQFTVSRWPMYSASKSALGMIIEELAVDLGVSGIRVNGIAPGWVALDDQGNQIPNSRTPLHKSSIHPAYIGRAAVFLASDYLSPSTTGTVLTVDGGLSLYNARVSQCPPEEVR